MLLSKPEYVLDAQRAAAPARHQLVDFPGVAASPPGELQIVRP
jgi:hypothetical protein